MPAQPYESTDPDWLDVPGNPELFDITRIASTYKPLTVLKLTRFSVAPTPPLYAGSVSMALLPLNVALRCGSRERSGSHQAGRRPQAVIDSPMGYDKQTPEETQED